MNIKFSGSDAQGFHFNFGGTGNAGEPFGAQQQPQQPRKPRKGVASKGKRIAINLIVTLLVGAGYFYINLPAIMPTVIITLIMAVGNIMAVGTDKVLLMKNDLNISTSEVIGTYVYERGLISGEFGYATAVGLFTNVVNLILLLTVNKISARVSDTSLF